MAGGLHRPSGFFIPMTVTEHFRADFAAINNAAIAGNLPTEFTFNGADYVGTFTDLRKSDSVEVGGFVREYDARLHVDPLLFDIVPKVGGFVTVAGYTFKIEAADLAPDGVELILSLSANN